MSVLRHLPAIIVRDDTTDWFVMASACGKRGPLATRDTAEGGQVELLNLDSVCPECMVKWDAAEESGGLRLVWQRSAKVTWEGPGAPLMSTEPTPWRCPHCNKPAGGQLFMRTIVTCFAVVVRDQRPKIVKLLPLESQPGASAHRPEGET